MELFISFSEIMHFFKRNRVKFLLVVLAFGIVCGLLPLKFLHFSYSANTTLTLSCEIPENADADYRQQYSGILGIRVSTAVAQAGSNDLVEKTAERLHLDKGSISKISGEQMNGAPVIKLTVQTADGGHAAQISDTAAQILGEEITQQFSSPKLTAVITDKAQPVQFSSKKSSMVKAGILGLILGFIIYVCYGLICVLSDRSVRNARFAEENMKTKLLGEVPHDKRGTEYEDAFRKLRAVALHQCGTAKCFMIASAGKDSGGAETAAGFAAALAGAGKKVLAVDANLREPALAERFKVQPAKTLNDVLSGSASLPEAVSEVPGYEGLNLVAAGNAEKANPADLLAKSFAKLKAEAGEQFDYIIVSAPSESEYPDLESIAAAAQAVVLTAQYGTTSYKVLHDSLRSVAEAGGIVAGFVITDV